MHRSPRSVNYEVITAVTWPLHDAERTTHYILHCGGHVYSLGLRHVPAINPVATQALSGRCPYTWCRSQELYREDVTQGRVCVCEGRLLSIVLWTAVCRCLWSSKSASVQTCMLINSIELNQFTFFWKLIKLIQFLFHASWLVVDSIRFHKVGDWVDWLWVTDMIESIQMIPKILKKVNEIEGFPKKKSAYILSWLIDLVDWIILFILASWLSRFIRPS